MKKIIIIVAGVLVLLGGGGAAVYFLKPDLLSEAIRPQDKDAEHAKAEGEEEKAGGEKKVKKKKAGKKDDAREAGADLDVFVVNLTGDLVVARPQVFASLLLTGVETDD